jgi:hypothetical protein
MFVKRREITAFTTQQVMPVAQEGMEKMAPSVAKVGKAMAEEMAPTYGKIAKEIAKGVKDGMKDDWRLNDKSYQKLEDFQPLSKTANDAKRQHCKRCLETGIRYDAKKLGYSESYVFGNASSKTCVGCYWYDPVAFNKEISKDFIKSDK